MAIKAVLFDLDGTLVDSFRSIIEAFNASLVSIGEKEQPEEVIKAHIGVPHKITLKKFVPSLENDEGRLKIALDAFHKKRFEVTGKYTKAGKGVIELLDYLRAKGIKTAIVTTTSKDMTKKIISDCGMTDLIDVIVSKDDVANLKPHPEPVELAIEKLGVDRGDVIMVGDHPNDIMAANAAKVRSIGILNFYRSNILKRYKPFAVIKEIGEIKKYI